MTRDINNKGAPVDFKVLATQPLNVVDFDDFNQSFVLHTDNLNIDYQTPEVGTNKYFFTRSFPGDDTARSALVQNIHLQKVNGTENGVLLDFDNAGGVVKLGTSNFLDCFDTTYFDKNTGIGSSAGNRSTFDCENFSLVDCSPIAV